MQLHQQRVVDEQSELNEKINKLSDFIKTSPLFEGLPIDEQERLMRQKYYMIEYSDVLAERIAAFSLS